MIFREEPQQEAREEVAYKTSSRPILTFVAGILNLLDTVSALQSLVLLFHRGK